MRVVLDEYGHTERYGLLFVGEVLMEIPPFLMTAVAFVNGTLLSGDKTAVTAAVYICGRQQEDAATAICERV